MGHRYGEGVTLNNMGEAYLDLGRLDEAISSIEDARQIFIEVGTFAAKATRAQPWRGYLCWGGSAGAVTYFGRALNIRQRAGGGTARQRPDLPGPGPCAGPVRWAAPQVLARSCLTIFPGLEDGDGGSQVRQALAVI